MRCYIRYIINGIMCIMGGVLMAVFLISDRWMRNPNYYDEKAGGIVHRFNIGFHWTTLIGMAGVVLLIVGAAGLIKVEKYVLGLTALTAVAVSLCSWEFFFSMSETYFELVLGFDRRIVLVYYSLKLLSLIFAVILLAIMIMNKKKNKVLLSYRILAALTLLSALGCLLFITVCNHWYLLQSALAVLAVALLFGGQILYAYIEKKRRRAGWRVL